MAKNYELSLREKANIAGGALVGFIMPVAFLRYSSCPKAENILEEVAYWTTATIASTPFQAIGAVAGLGAGVMSATQLRSQRADKERVKESPLAEA